MYDLQKSRIAERAIDAELVCLRCGDITEGVGKSRRHRIAQANEYIADEAGYQDGYPVCHLGFLKK
jgi:hypothetical protein